MGRPFVLAVTPPSIENDDAEVEQLRHALRNGILTPGERDALETLYLRYHDLVWETVYPLLASAADADDITQTVFVGLPGALRSYKPGNFEAWLRRVAVRFALMSIRASKRATVREERGFDALLDDLDTDSCWQSALAGDGEPRMDARYGNVRRAFYALPETIREVVFLRAIVELSHDEIAEWLGISVGACYTRYCRGLSQLRNALDGFV